MESREHERVECSRRARAAIVAAAKRSGRQTIVLSWPGGATYLPTRCYEPGDFDVVIRHIAGCPVFVDARRLGLFTDRRVLLDTERGSAVRPNPPLYVRTLPAAADEDLRP